MSNPGILHHSHTGVKRHGGTLLQCGRGKPSHGLVTTDGISDCGFRIDSSSWHLLVLGGLLANNAVIRPGTGIARETDLLIYNPAESPSIDINRAVVETANSGDRGRMKNGPREEARFEKATQGQDNPSTQDKANPRS